MENKKIKNFKIGKAFASFGKFTWVGKILLLGGIFAAAGMLYLFVAGGGGVDSSSMDNPAASNGGADGILADILQNGSAIASKSWHQVFGGSDQIPQDSAAADSDEIDLDAGSSTATTTIATSQSSEAGQTFSSGADVVDTAGADSADTASSISQASQPAAKATKTKTAKVVPEFCSFGNAGAATGTDAGANASASDGIILNEIAWMGSVAQDGETGAKASEREWIELKNISTAPVDISGWQVLDEAGNMKIILGAGDGSISDSTTIPAGGFYLLVRGDGSLPDVQTDAGYSGSLPNTGDQLAVFDANCNVSDFLDASSGWPGGNNTTKQTMERDAGGVGAVAGWHTSSAPGGTPRAENSVASASSTSPVPASSVATTSAMNANAIAIAPVVVVATSSSPGNANASAPQYLISVSAIGDGNGTVSDAVASSSAGILCGFTCEASYAAGTKINFTATPSVGSLFRGWSGACKSAGTGAAIGTCSFVVSSSVSVVAEFDAAPPVAMASASASASAPAPASVSSSTDSDNPTTASHLLIAAIQIAGASSSNDFVKIFNPTTAAIDISGWKLHKKSSTGTDASLRTLPTGSSVAPGGYFVWANSANGFSETIAADVSSTETLSADNSVALFDAAGNIIDQVAWGTGTNQYVESSAYPTDPTANQVLARKVANDGSGGAAVMVDTDDNAADFAIQ